MTRDEFTRRMVAEGRQFSERERTKIAHEFLTETAKHDDRQRRTKTRELPVLRPLGNEAPEVLPDDAECPDVVASEAARGVVRS